MPYGPAVEACKQLAAGARAGSPPSVLLTPTSEGEVQGNLKVRRRHAERADVTGQRVMRPGCHQSVLAQRLARCTCKCEHFTCPSWCRSEILA